MFKRRARGLAGATAMLALLAGVGCRREEITVYRVPKETPRQAVAPGHSTASPAAPQLRWTTPTGWQEQPGSGMRLAQFTAPGPDGLKAEVSIVALAGVAGKDLDVINIFRERVPLPPATAADLAGLARPTAIGSLEGRLYDMTGPSTGDSNSVRRLVVAVLTQGGSSWFFNLSGESRCVEEQKPAFVEFLRSVELETAQASAPGPETARPATASGSASGRESRKPSWDLPPGWTELPATSMVLARFGADSNGGKVEVSISAFPGDVGGLVANVNRWRGQIGLARVEDAEAQRLATPLDVPAGRAMLVDMSGQKDGKAVRLIGAMMPHAGQTWFFKLLGDEPTAAHQKAAFLKFLQTVRFPHA